MGLWYRIKRAIYRLLGRKIEQKIVREGSQTTPTSSTPSSQTSAGIMFDPSAKPRNLVNQWITVPRSGRQQILMEEDFQKLDKSDHDFLLTLDTRYENMNDETRNRVHQILNKLR
ncbi:MAG: hypothetical protein KGY80_12455 [Candidatus Thorarchaeota archaeon]|nr:hypothetical protein [Candidatus Thorarchaeota archaeon]